MSRSPVAPGTEDVAVTGGPRAGLVREARGRSGAQIARHMFVIAPNNSGSTLLRRALGRSRGAWTLSREGQHVPGFHGPSTRGTRTRLLWASDRQRIELFSDPGGYDWVKTRRAWHSQAVSSGPRASVLIVSSPPFLLCVDQLRAHFANAKFLFLVRDPYAILEGICRRPDPGLAPGERDCRLAAARHIAACFDRQLANIAAHADRGIALSYEAMCDSPAGIAQRIAAHEPALGDVDLSGRIRVKGLYDEPPRNMNDDQIARLTREDFAAANSVFDRHRPLFDSFGYRRREG